MILLYLTKKKIIIKKFKTDLYQKYKLKDKGELK
jgi:hypothetical protein